MEYILYPLLVFVFLVWLFLPLGFSHWLMDQVKDFFESRRYGFNFSVNMAILSYIFVCSMYYGIPITYVLISLAKAN